MPRRCLNLQRMYTFRQISNISRTNSQNVHVPHLVLQLFCPIHWSQVLSQEWRCSWSSAASDVPTTSDWSSNILPPKVRLISKVLRYMMCEYVWLCRSQCFCFYSQQFEPVKRDPKTYGQFYSGDAYIVLKVRFCYGQDICGQLRISHLKKKSKLFLFAPRILELTSYFGGIFHYSGNNHWKLTIVMVTTLSPLAEDEVVVMIICGVDSDDKVGIMPFQDVCELSKGLYRLANWGQNKMTAILLTAFPNSFLSMKIFHFM